MPNTFEVVSRDGSRVKWRVLDADGHFVSGGDGEYPEVIEEARARKVSVASLLQKKVAAGSKPAEREVEVVEMPEGRTAYILPEHEHDTYDLKGHEHKALTDADALLARGQLEIDQRVKALGNRVWAEQQHSHTALEEAIVFSQETTTRLSIMVGKLHEEQIGATEERAKQAATLAQLVEAVNKLSDNFRALHAQVQKISIADQRIDVLKDRLDALPPNIAPQAHDHPLKDHRHSLEVHEHEMAQHEHSMPDHEHALAVHEHAVSDHEHNLAQHDHALPDHDHKIILPDHEHEYAVPGHEHVPEPHDHPVRVHSHPEIVGLFTPEKLKEAGKRRGAHIHEFDTMDSDGKGWKCGICGIARSEVNG